MTEPLERARRLHALAEACGARGPRQPARDIQRLSAGFGEERADRRADYMNDPALRAAYLAFFVPQYAAKIAAILERSAAEGQLVLPAAPRVLDVGAGPLSGTLGAWLACGALGPSVALDLSLRSMESGREILRELMPAADVRLVDVPVQRRPLPAGTFDLIIVAHVLNEIGDPRRALPQRLELVSALLDRLAPGGRLLVVEPGTRVHGRAVMALRDELARGGVSIHGPCRGARRCPLLTRPADWCHAEEPWEAPPVFAALEDVAGLHKTVLKHSHLVLSREPVGGARGVRLIGGVMKPKDRPPLRYACGPDGLVTLQLSTRELRPAIDAPRGALFDVPLSALMPSRDRGAPTGRRGAASGPRPGAPRGARRRR